MQGGDDVHQFIRIAFVDLDVKRIDAGEFLNSTTLPSITGLPASAPMLPSPSTALPLVMTPTRLPLAVYS
jgi:hypothetical protein